MRNLSRLAAAALVAAASTLAAPPPAMHDQDHKQPSEIAGWTNGKACSDANGCRTRNTLSSCISCCDFFCATVYLECVDTCLGAAPKQIGSVQAGGTEGDLIRSINGAALAIEGNRAVTSDYDLIQDSMKSPIPRVRAVATALAKDSKMSGVFERHLDPDQGGRDDLAGI